MVECINCKSQNTVENVWGNWCDACGGVMLPGSLVDDSDKGLHPGPPRLFFRHVATVSGAGGRYPIVFDLSAGQYAIAWPRKVELVKCQHCGQNTPVERTGLGNLDDLKLIGYHSARGTLDAIIAVGQPIAKGDSDELPELSAAPSSTEEERKIILQ